MSTAKPSSATRSNTPAKHVGYRPEIDGLRCIAVVAVIIYHADLAFNGTAALPGGFLGVDIFFVISGFLITSIILRELQTTSRFSFARFYERRARRILPALFIVMLTSLPLAWMLMPPVALIEFSGSGLAALFFGSNFWFWQENSYTAEISQLKPFLHTWTLSVEEQFYVFFPILLLLIWKFFKRWAFAIIIGISIVSLCFAHYGSTRFSDATFYLLPTRGWELLAGSALAFQNGSAVQSNDRWAIARNFAPAIGLIAILVSMVLFNDNVNHPSAITAIPILGTVMLIGFASKDDWVTKILSHRVFVGIGLISYSLYLWHFPVFAFARLAEWPPTLLNKAILVLASVALATATYFWIEQPFRRKERIATKPFVLIMTATFLALTTAFVGMYSEKIVPGKYATAQEIIDLNYDYKPVFRAEACFLSPRDMEPYVGTTYGDRSNPFDNCVTENQSPNKPTIFLWGDSHMAHLYAGYAKFWGAKYNIVQRTASACNPFIGRRQNHRPGCKEVNDIVLRELLETKPERIVFAAHWYPGHAIQLSSTLDLLKENGFEDIQIVGPVPRWERPMPVLLTEILNRGEPIPNRLSEAMQPNLYEAEEELRSLSEQRGYIYHSPLQILCEEKSCLTRVSAGPQGITQWDAAHLTKDGSEYVVANFE